MDYLAKFELDHSYRCQYGVYIDWIKAEPDNGTLFLVALELASSAVRPPLPTMPLIAFGVQESQ